QMAKKADYVVRNEAPRFAPTPTQRKDLDAIYRETDDISLIACPPVRPNEEAFKMVEMKKKNSTNIKLTREMFNRLNDGVKASALIGITDDETWSTASSCSRSDLSLSPSHSATSLPKKSREKRTGRKRCFVCGCPYLRVVTSFESDQRVVECMRRSCLASLEHTNLPVGYMYGVAEDDKGWFTLDLNRIYYPKKQFDPNFHFSNKKPVKCQLDVDESILVPCPGQNSLVKLM
ncbi:hypothetical protein PFISCL1PPCAC_6077, partial [Pristionchus fissidentatus]